MIISMRKSIINNEITLNEYTDGILFGTDALLLTAFSWGSSRRIGCDLGGGSGVISLLTLSCNYANTMYSVEVQKKYSELAELNFGENGYLDKAFSVLCDVRDISSHIPSGTCDFVLSNPPYMPPDSGKKNEKEEKRIARHEIHGGITDFCKAAYWCLRSGGNFYTVYRPERLPELFLALQNQRLAPKRLKTVHPSSGEPPSLILCEAKKDASNGLIFESPLYIYKDKNRSSYTVEMDSIMQSLKIKRQR